MNRTHLAAWLTLLALASIHPLAAQESAKSGKNEPYATRYRIHFLDNHAAEQLAWDQCAGKDCRVSWQSGDLELRADAATHERLARALTVADAPRTQNFQLTLLAADSHAESLGSELPKSAQKALDDMKDFLPFKGYRVLDTAWMRTTANAEAHLVGDQGIPYAAELMFNRIGEAGGKDLLIERFVVRSGFAETPQPAAKDAKTPAAAPRAPQDLIRTTFGMHVGETVVVGTSKLSGSSSALVVLLTAVP